MSINQLLHHHQLAMMNAVGADSAQDRDTYFDLVSYYAKRITAWRQDRGLSDRGWPGSAIAPAWTRD